MAFVSNSKKNSDGSPLQRIRDVQHFGEEGGVVPGVDAAATSTFLDPLDMEKTFRGEKQGCYLYSRHSNPTVNAFGKKMAALENTEAALGVASGMAAITCAVEQLLPEPGLEIVASETVYGGTYAYFANVLPKRGIRVRWVDAGNLKSVASAITPKTRILYTETLSNPLLALPELEDLGRLARENNLTWIVDNTFAPLLVNPKRWGANVIVHSCTKFISGSSDMIAGAICGSGDFINQLIDVNHGEVMLRGPIMDARIAHELYLRLDHLAPRMLEHGRYALHLAKQLEQQKVPVIYPGLESHPNHKRVAQYFESGFGYGAMLTVDCGSPERAFRLGKALQDAQFGLYAVSLGFSRTLMSVPAVSTSSEIPEDRQTAMGLSKGLLRLSVGYTGDLSTMTERFLSCWSKCL